jgi:hypothetical protein
MPRSSSESSHLVEPICPDSLLLENPDYVVNPTSTDIEILKSAVANVSFHLTTTPPPAPLKMPTLLLLIFLLQLTLHIINTLGANTINTLIWTLYLRIPSPISSLIQKQRVQKASFVTLSSSLASTSSQDQFAKWAKIRRQLDKVTTELESTSCVFPVSFLFLFSLESFSSSQLLIWNCTYKSRAK